MHKDLLRKFLPLIGPIALFLLWSLILEAKWAKPILLPPPGATLTYMAESFISGAIFNDLFGSRLPVGSSARITDGWLIKALATATRCCSPPDNSLGL